MRSNDHALQRTGLGRFVLFGFDFIEVLFHATARFRPSQSLSLGRSASFPVCPLKPRGDGLLTFRFQFRV